MGDRVFREETGAVAGRKEDEEGVGEGEGEEGRGGDRLTGGERERRGGDEERGEEYGEEEMRDFSRSHKVDDDAADDVSSNVFLCGDLREATMCDME